MSDSRTYASLRAQLAALDTVLRVNGHSAGSWSDILWRLREAEYTAALLEHDLREPILTHLHEAKRFAENGNAPMARHAILRAEQSLP